MTFGLAIFVIANSYGQSVGDQFRYAGDGGMNLIYQITHWTNKSDGDNQVCVSGTGDTPETVKIPQTVTDSHNNKYKVVSVFRFADAIKVKKIEIPEGVTTISKGAFGRLTGLQSISLPASLTKIEDAAF